MAERQALPGDVLVVTLPSGRPPGREQHGRRPVVLVAVPRGPLRYPVAIVVPLTTQQGPWSQQNPEIYPVISRGAGGLPQDSVALLDQVRSLDASRVEGFLGRLSQAEFAPLGAGLRHLFGPAKEPQEPG